MFSLQENVIKICEPINKFFLLERHMAVIPWKSGTSWCLLLINIFEFGCRRVKKKKGRRDMVRWNQYLPRGWQSTVRLNWHYATSAKWWQLPTLGTVCKIWRCYNFSFLFLFSGRLIFLEFVIQSFELINGGWLANCERKGIPDRGDANGEKMFP